jgi:hypothetical protein
MRRDGRLTPFLYTENNQVPAFHKSHTHRDTLNHKPPHECYGGVLTVSIGFVWRLRSCVISI